MRLRAKVQKVTGYTANLRGVVDDGHIVAVEQIPAPASVEIEPADGAFLLLHLDERERCIADTWHETLDDAKNAARLEFGISEADWVPV